MREQRCVISALCQRVLVEGAISQREAGDGGWMGAITQLPASVRGDRGPVLRAQAGTAHFPAPGGFKEQNWAVLLHKIHLNQIPAFTEKPRSPSFLCSILSVKYISRPSFSPPKLSCFVSCWGFTTGQIPRRSERHLNKHQQNMSEGACEQHRRLIRFCSFAKDGGGVGDSRFLPSLSVPRHAASSHG